MSTHTPACVTDHGKRTIRSVRLAMYGPAARRIALIGTHRVERWLSVRERCGYVEAAALLADTHGPGETYRFHILQEEDDMTEMLEGEYLGSVRNPDKAAWLHVFYQRVP